MGRQKTGRIESVFQKPEIFFHDPVSDNHSNNLGRDKRGFTLIELLLGLGIFAVLAASVYLTYSNAVRIDRESGLRSELACEAYWTLCALEEDLERMVAYRYMINEKDVGPVFVGEENSLTLLTEGQETLQWVSYDLESPETGKVQQTHLGIHTKENVDQVLERHRGEEREQTLTRSAASFYGRSISESKTISREILSKNLAERGLRLSYAKKTISSYPPQLSWQNEWKGQAPPDAVRITLRLIDGKSGVDCELSKDVLFPMNLDLSKDQYVGLAEANNDRYPE